MMKPSSHIDGPSSLLCKLCSQDSSPHLQKKYNQSKSFCLSLFPSLVDSHNSKQIKRKMVDELPGCEMDWELSAAQGNLGIGQQEVP